MRTNLIQTYMNNLNTPQDRNLDIKYELSNRTFIKPLPASGKLVKNSILEAPAVWAQDTAYDFKSYHDTLHGKGNDHELGKVNDLGMKIGGLVIAGYLMTRKQTPLKKAMELVGLASFFGAMSLWPKLALQLPARMIHGFNIRQEYIDSYGRKKMFFQDPQYIPWDLVDENKINKIGDRMGVDKDIPNRRDFIQEKMKKTAVQNNTLWMMTAGFATPIMSALICNLCEKPLTKLIDNVRTKNANTLLESIDTVFAKYKDSNAVLKNMLNSNMNATLTPQLIEDITKQITQGFDDVTSTGIKADLTELLGLGRKTYSINDKVIENIEAAISEAVSKDVVPTNLKEVLKDSMGKELTEEEMKRAMYRVLRELKNTMKLNNTENIEGVISGILNTSDNAINKALHSNPLTTLTPEKAAKLTEISEKLLEFRAKNRVLDEYIYLRAGAAPETGIANMWNDITGKFPKLFEITDKEITAARHDRSYASELLRSKFEAITSDKAKYEQVCKKLVEELTNLENVIANLGQNGGYSAAVDRVFDGYAAELRNLGFGETADRLVGKNGVPNGSLKNIQHSFIKDRLLGVRSSMYRMLNTLDFYRRISSLTNIQALHDGMPLEVKEEIVELAKKLAIEGSTSDFMTKFYELRNPNPSPQMGQIRVKYGKVLNRFLNKAVDAGRVDLPNDKKFFQEIMRLLFENDMHPDTARAISESLVKEPLLTFRREFAQDLGNSEYFVKPYHLLHGYKNGVSSYTKFLRMGMAPDQMLHNVIKETFNTRKWLKMFGGFGAGLLGVTVLAQFFFGKMKPAQGGQK